jgi:hypothetical protein
VVQSGGRCGFFPERRKIMDLQPVSLSELESVEGGVGQLPLAATNIGTTVGVVLGILEGAREVYQAAEKVVSSL